MASVSALAGHDLPDGLGDLLTDGDRPDRSASRRLLEDHGDAPPRRSASARRARSPAPRRLPCVIAARPVRAMLRDEAAGSSAGSRSCRSRIRRGSPRVSPRLSARSTPLMARIRLRAAGKGDLQALDVDEREVLSAWVHPPHAAATASGAMLCPEPPPTSVAGDVMHAPRSASAPAPRWAQTLLGEGAARVEAAAGRRIDRVRRIAGERRLLGAVVRIHGRHASERGRAE